MFESDLFFLKGSNLIFIKLVFVELKILNLKLICILCCYIYYVCLGKEFIIFLRVNSLGSWVVGFFNEK